MIRILVPLVLLAGAACTEPADVPPAESSEVRFVYSSQLVIREHPGVDEAAVDTLRFGDRVEVLEQGAADRFGTIADHWYRLRAGETEGFAFGATLLPVPVPDLEIGDFQSLVSQLAPVGQPDTTASDGFMSISHHYTHGVEWQELRFLMGDGGYFSEEQLWVDHLSAYQGYVLARAVVCSTGIDCWELKREAEVQMDENGSPSVYDDSDWRIIAVSESDGRVRISFPERAD